MKNRIARTLLDQHESAEYQMVRQFEMRTDRSTKVITAVSVKRAIRERGDRMLFRVATLREHIGKDGVVRRSPWLGTRELLLKAVLEQQAMDFIAGQTAELRVPSMTVSE
jgi:hypothetical protein